MNLCENGMIDEVSSLIKKEQFETDIIQKGFYKACVHAHIEIIKLLLKDSKCDPLSTKNYAIKIASMYGQYEVVKLLLTDERVDPS